jgi:hypothetical protein
MISNVECPVSLRERLKTNGMPNDISKLVDVVEWLRDSKKIFVEAIVSGNHIGRDRSSEYIVRVSDDSGGNVSKISCMSYPESIEIGIETAVRIFF